MKDDDPPPGRQAPIEMTAAEFRAAGHAVVDRLADFLATQKGRPVAPGLEPEEIRALLAGGGPPEQGAAALPLLEEAARLVLDHSTLSGHPRFLAYVVSSPSPIGALADLMAAVVNPNVGAWDLAPIATEIEAQTVRWIAGMLGYPVDCGGLLTSGGNMANFIGFLAARKAKTPWDVRVDGAGRHGREAAARSTRRPRRTPGSTRRPTSSASAPDRSAGSTTDDAQRMDVDALRRQVREDRAAGWLPFLVAATAGTVSTGAVDPARAHRRGVPRGGALVPRRRGLRRFRGGRSRRAGGPAGHRAGRLGRGRSAQVALRAARGGLRAGARPGSRCATPSSITRSTTTSGTRASEGGRGHQLLPVRRRRTRAASGP